MKKTIYGLLILVLVFTVLVVPNTKVKALETCESPIDESTIKVEDDNYHFLIVSSRDNLFTKEDVFNEIAIRVTAGEGASECELTSDDFEVISGLDEVNSFIKEKGYYSKDAIIVFKLKDSDFTFEIEGCYSHDKTTTDDMAGLESLNYDYNDGELTIEKIAELVNIPKRVNNGTVVVSTNYYFMDPDDLADVNEKIRNRRTEAFYVFYFYGYDDGAGDYEIYGCFIWMNITDGKVNIPDNKPVVNTSTSKPENNDKNGYVLGIMIIALGGVSTIFIKKKKQ